MDRRGPMTRIMAVFLSLMLLCACGAQTPAAQIPAVTEPAAQIPAVTEPAAQIPAVTEPAAQIPVVTESADQAAVTADDSAPKEEDDRGMDDGRSAEAVAGQLLAGMDTKHKLAQMLMPDVRMWKENGTGKGVTTLGRELAEAIGRYGFGGVILFEENLKSAEQAAALTASLQEANALGGNPAGLLLAVDQEGGAVTRIATGTAMPGNMALAATGDTGDAELAARVTGEELAALGINVDLAPVLDINSNPDNPVIGVRSYSDDPAAVGAYAAAFQAGLHSAGVMTALKHFPGHGDTATDSHTGLPVIDKSLEELTQTDLLPYVVNTDSADLVMTAHIRYPQIERETCRSGKTGEEITLPATLSHTILTDLLRGKLGYDGVIVTDAMNMQAVAAHFTLSDMSKRAITAGADLLLMPVEMDSGTGIREMGEYIDSLAEMVDRGEIPQERIDGSVMRILKLKVRYGLAADAGTRETAGTSCRQAADPENAARTVGSKAHHDIEWEIAKHAVTLLKNDGDLLPLSGKEKIVIVCPKQTMIRSAEYAIARLREDGLLPEDAGAGIVCCAGSSAAHAEDIIGEADTLIGISAVSRTGEMDPADREGAGSVYLDTLITETHRKGGRFILLSAGLPYDAARYPEADAILACYNAKGMSVLPGESGDMPQYGPNIPAALYTIFGGSSPCGRLPVNIPRLDSGTSPGTDGILYPRGFGIAYR